VSPWSAAAIVALVASITYVMRAGVIVVLGGRALPVAVERVVRNVGPAVLAALAVNLAAGGDGGPHLTVAEAAALVAAGLVAWRTRNLLATLVGGMTVLWLMTWWA
jgi:branched-subunit amino acid transport protein